MRDNYTLDFPPGQEARDSISATDDDILSVEVAPEFEHGETQQLSVDGRNRFPEYMRYDE